MSNLESTAGARGVNNWFGQIAFNIHQDIRKKTDTYNWMPVSLFGCTKIKIEYSVIIVLLHLTYFLKDLL